MAKKYVVPNVETATSLLEMIFGEGLTLSDNDDADMGSNHVATFLSDDDRLVALCACDTSFVAYAGAALSMIPADAANEMIQDNDLSDMVTANFYEVMNICSKLMMSDSSAHLRLGKTLAPAESAEAVGSLQGKTKGFTLDIPGYGKGVMTFVIAEAA